MNKAFLISIQPKWCEHIASGKKTIEVRRTRPKLETPFKCYMYMTKDCKKHYYIDEYDNRQVELIPQKVIGEFVCDRIDTMIGLLSNTHTPSDKDEVEKSTCLTVKEITEYLKPKNGGFGMGYGWHISDLKIYDTPKELGEFFGFGECKLEGMSCHSCKYMEHGNSWAGIEPDCDAAYDGLKRLDRPPMSWYYVEEI